MLRSVSHWPVFSEGVDAISRRFTNLGIVGVTAIQNITIAAVNFAKP
jgi:hypothetical protein